MAKRLTYLHPDRPGARHRRRAGAQRRRSTTARRRRREQLTDDRGLFLDRHHAVPAADQDDHRAAGVLDAGRRHRAYGRHRGAGPGRRCKPIGWFVGASLVSLTLGLILVNLLQPGVGLDLADPAGDARRAASSTAAFDLNDFISHIVPASMIEAMANNEILQIVVFSVFVGVAITAVGEKAAPLVTRDRGAGAGDAAGHQLRHALRAVRGVRGGDRRRWPSAGRRCIGDLGYFMGTFYLGLVLLWCAADRRRLPDRRARGRGCWSATSASRCCSPSRPPRRRPPIRARWRRSTGSACRRGSPASCCRWAIRSTSTAR